jgi:hypothetical protein
MDPSAFTILLARQRSGTHALRSVLDTHPEVFCFDEVFSIWTKDDRNPFWKEFEHPVAAANYFNFVEAYARDDLGRLLPTRHGELFERYFEHLRGLAAERQLVVDVKYNSTHFFTRPFQPLGSSYFLDLVAEHGLKVLRVTRKNYVRYAVSTAKARAANRYHARTGGAAGDGTVRLDPRGLLQTLERCEAEDDALDARFRRYPHLLERDYAEIFPGGGEAISATFLDAVAGWLGVAPAFRPASAFPKQSSLPLAETIANFDEVAAALRGTRFARCLDDEPSYRADREC